MHEVAIVGAGFGGLGMAIRLKQQGTDFVLIERAEDVGGTWWANSYPGCQCDIPSNLYSFSFARNPNWNRAYPMRDQILEYLRDCARRFGVMPQTRLGCELLGADWSPAGQRWELETTTGPIQARVLVAAPGLLSEPFTPELPGLDRFQGNVFHTARWDHSEDLTGKRVALLGSGATAVQVMPEIQPKLGRLHLFQRTPPWVIPHMDHPVRDEMRELYRRVPLLQRLSRGVVYALRETMALGITRDRRWLKALELNARLHLRRQVRDPELRARLTPDYEIFCKRIVLSSKWYPAIQAPNVDLVTSGVRELRERSIVDGDGLEREIDTLILATGFTPSELPIAERIRGRDGRSLAESWNGSPEAYLGTTVAGFPNLLFFYGPNLNLAHSSIVYMLESQMSYALDALRTMRLRGAAEFEVRPEAQAAYNEEVQERLATTVWNTGGCGSWYFDRTGRNSIQWPGFTFEYRRRTRRFDAAAYRLAPAA
ncbi:MAG TPA: NAD(P)/FAD-dependent oxidoreductase [Thermoleophilaceae bacterium]|nr:NAD(P)/FAD-dependent oxidoreductase [Thermoleophilaceae bacterium]